MYKPGDYFVICDMSGRKSLRSECVKQWDGAIVRKEYARIRHPLDRQRPPPVEAYPKETRPVNDIFVDYGDITPDDF